MSDEVRLWLQFAGENLRVAELCLENRLYNPCLQNAHQAVEKALKALCLKHGLSVKRTHSISGLDQDLRAQGAESGLTQEECDLLDSVYLPSKYPLGSALPDFHPDEAIARQCVDLAKRVARLTSSLTEE